MDIVFSSLNSPTIQIHPAVTINDDYSYYQITTKECPVSHIVTLKSTRFLALNHDGRIYIFNLKNNGFFPKDFQNYYIEGIRDKLIAYFTYEPFTYYTSKDKQKAIIDDTTNTYRFVPIRAIRSQDCRQTEALDLSNAKKKIEELNVILTQTCPDFYLRINYIASFPPNSNIHLFSTIFPDDLNSFYTFPNIVLCLFTGNDCVSSITMHFNAFIHDDGVLGKISELSIDSKTSLRFEGRKFNKLLRAVAIIISKEIDPTIDTLTSFATNPVSAFIMIKNFNAYTLDLDRKKIIGKPASVDIDDFVLGRLLKTYVELNDDNIENAKSVFMDIVQTKNKDKRIKCDKQKDETAADRIRSRYYGRLGINFGRGGKQTKKRRGHKQKGRKQSGGRKRTYKLK